MELSIMVSTCQGPAHVTGTPARGKINTTTWCHMVRVSVGSNQGCVGFITPCQESAGEN